MSRFDALVCDLDGVVYRGAEPIAGAVEALNRLRDSGVRILYCTNNSFPTVGEYLHKLRGFGLRLGARDIITSAVVTAETLQQRGLSGTAAVVVGGPGIHEALAGVGIRIDDENPDADVVVVGLDPDFTYETMRRAATAVRRGALLVATNGDATFPAAGDELWPGAGAILAAVEAASGATAEIMGKPHRPMADTAARRLEDAARVAVVGDRPDTDLALGRVHGWSTVLVLTGVTDEGAARALDPQPDLVLDGLADLASGGLGT